jgi:hypothetical protein
MKTIHGKSEEEYTNIPDKVFEVEGDGDTAYVTGNAKMFGDWHAYANLEPDGLVFSVGEFTYLIPNAALEIVGLERK